MNSQFHTPSLGDESFDLSGICETAANTIDLAAPNFHPNNLEHFDSKRMQSMEQSISVSGISIADYGHYGGGGIGITGDNTMTGNGINDAYLTTHMNNNINNIDNINAPFTQSAGAAKVPGSVELGAPTYPTQMSTGMTTTLAARKQLSPIITDPNEPEKPLSAYSQFFRDTAFAIKQQNPIIEFQELTRIVSSMWETLDESQKYAYTRKTENARLEYLRKMRIYRQQQQNDMNDFTSNINNVDEVSNQTCNLTANSHFIQNLPFEQKLQLPQQQLQQHQQHQQPPQQLMHTQQSLNTIGVTPPTLATTENVVALPQLDSNSTNGVEAASTVATTTTSSTTTGTITNNNNAPGGPPEQIQNSTPPVKPVICIREGCKNSAIVNPDWEDEYCSNECVVVHCRNVFNDWVQQNRDATPSVQ